jgi:protein involved in polysaccharide export with SLBB domain
MMIARLIFLLGLTLGFGEASLAQTAAAPMAPMGAPTGAAAVVAERLENEYKLGAGDKIRIIVFGEDTLSGEFFVSGAGKISFPLIGDLDAGGHTIRDLQAAITTKLADGYLKDPRVSAEVLDYRPFYILGEVNKPGEYPYTSGLTVMRAVATAQGFTYRANQRKVFIKRVGEASEHPVPLTADTFLEPGDTIRIVERYF